MNRKFLLLIVLSRRPFDWNQSRFNETKHFNKFGNSTFLSGIPVKQGVVSSSDFQMLLFL